MEARPHARVCYRAREYASRRLDGELSDFETALLDNHLERCVDCRLFAAELEGIVDRLRSAPLEELQQPIALPSRRRAPSRILRGSAVAAAAAVALTAALAGGLHSGGSARRQEASIRSSIADSQDVQRLHQIIAANSAPDTNRIWSLALKGGQWP